MTCETTGKLHPFVCCTCTTAARISRNYPNHKIDCVPRLVSGLRVCTSLVKALSRTTGRIRGALWAQLSPASFIKGRDLPFRKTSKPTKRAPSSRLRYPQPSVCVRDFRCFNWNHRALDIANPTTSIWGCTSERSLSRMMRLLLPSI